MKSVNKVNYIAFDDMKQIFEDLGVNLECSCNLELISDSQKDPKDIVVFCNTGWFIGGVERVMLTLLEALKEKYCMIMVSITNSAEHGYEIPKDIPFVVFNRFENKGFSNKLADFCNLINAKVFVGHANMKDPFMLAYGVLRERGIRTIILNHYNYLFPYRAEEGLAISEYRQQAFAQADVVLWLNSFDAAICGLRWQNVGVMSNPIRIEDRVVRTYPQEKKILAVARLDDLNKRVDRMLEIFAGIKKHESDAKLLLVGPYNLDIQLPWRNHVTIREYMSMLGLSEESVLFEGPKKEVSSYYLNASLLLVTSESEGFGMVLAEAGRFGVPAIVYDFDGQELIRDGYNGFVVEPDDVDTAVEKGIQLLNDSQLWQEMSRNAEENIQKYSVESVAERWDRLVCELIRGESGIQSICAAGLKPEFEQQIYERIAKSQDRILKILNEKERQRILAMDSESVTFPRRCYRKLKRIVKLLLRMDVN